MDINIGAHIKGVLDKRRETPGGLAGSLNVDAGVVSRIFKQSSIQTSQLKEISRILNYDFFGLYSADLNIKNEEKTGCEKQMEEKMLEIEALKKEIETLKIEEIKKENAFLKQINELLKKK